MNVVAYLNISKHLNNCPHCDYGNVGTDDSTGEWHGSLIVEDSLFTRKCRCGFSITVDANEDMNDKELKNFIQQKLNEYKGDN